VGFVDVLIKALAAIDFIASAATGWAVVLIAAEPLTARNLSSEVGAETVIGTVASMLPKRLRTATGLLAVIEAVTSAGDATLVRVVAGVEAETDREAEAEVTS
jgi:hypothetical protein